MKHHSPRARVVGALVGFLLVAAACGSDAKKVVSDTTPSTAASATTVSAGSTPSAGSTGGTAGTTVGTPAGTAAGTSAGSAAPSTKPATDVPQGGTLTIGAEQEPDCTDWINTCGGSSWGYWTMGVTTLPRSFDTKPDGSVVPCAAAGSLMFAPEITLAALKAMKAQYGDKIYGRYGFADAFNPHDGWIGRDVLGIDLGITLLSAENLRSGKIWFWFMQNKEITQALQRASIS